MLTVKNLQVSVKGKKILKGVNLVVKPGEVQVVMGPNGSGKSTLAYTLMGHPSYKLQDTNHKIKMEMDGKSLLGKTTDRRARMGLFLAFQNPVAVEGISVQKLLKRAYETVHCAECREGQSLDKCPRMSVQEFLKILHREARVLKVDEFLLSRSINEEFSGGEKKRIEVLQMAVLKPKYAILDEIDSGLDIDSLKTVADAIKKIRKKNNKMGIILITHYERILRYIKADYVHLMYDGRFIKSGDRRLANQIEKAGYRQIIKN